MTARKPSPTEQAVIDRFEAAPPAPESWHPTAYPLWVDGIPYSTCTRHPGHWMQPLVELPADERGAA